MSRFTAVVVLVLAATAAAVSITKCTDYDCKVGCKVTNVPSDTCVGGHTELKCTATSKYLFTVAKYNGTGCKTEAWQSTGVCNQCRKGDDGKYAIMTGCEGFSATSPMLDQYDCDATCTTCKSTKVLKDQCLFAPHGTNSWAFTGTMAVKELLTITQFSPNGTACAGPSETATAPTGVCLPDDVKGGSTLFQC
jgi:hypothetical protein